MEFCFNYDYTYTGLHFQVMLKMNDSYLIFRKQKIPPTIPYFMYFYACQYHNMKKTIIRLIHVRYELHRRKIKVFGKTNGLKSNIIREEIKKEMCELIHNIMISILPTHSLVQKFR